MGVHGAKAVEFKNKKAEANQFAKIVPTEQKKTKKEKVWVVWWKYASNMEIQDTRTDKL